MEIIINGKLAALKKGTSFEYISENRLFTGSDSYTLSITFPLKGCSQNIDIFGHLHRADVEKAKVVFDCDIRHGSFFASGSITVTEVSEAEIKTQFLEGRSEQNYDQTFDDIYLNELDLGYPSELSPTKVSPPTALQPYPTNNYVPLPWVNNYSGNLQNAMTYNTSFYRYTGWEDTKTSLSFQPYLLYILKRICEQLGYSYDFDKLEQSDYRYLLICNTLPSAWGATNFAIALPHWSLTEFFEQLEYFLFGEFDINHKAKSIKFSFSTDLTTAAGECAIDNVVDSYTTEITQDDESKYMASSNLKYADNDALLWDYYSCDWYIRANKKNARVFLTMDNLLAKAETLKESGIYVVVSGTRRTTYYSRSYSNTMAADGNKLLYCREKDTYFVMYCYKAEFYEQTPNGNKWYKYTNRLLPVNQFGELHVDDDADDIELKIVPAWIDGTDDTHGNVLFLDCGEMGDADSWTISTDTSTGSSSSSSTRDNASSLGSRGSSTRQQEDDTDYNDGALAQGQASRAISKGEPDKSDEYFSVIYVGFWDDKLIHVPHQPHPVTDRIEVTDDFKTITSTYTLRMNEGLASQSRSKMYQIDGKKKYHFTFLSDDIPNPRALFHIHGARYICEKITATFHESGKSQLLKGTFYRLTQ